MSTFKFLILIYLSTICYGTICAQSSEDQLYGFNRYVEIVEKDKSTHIDIIRSLSETSITLFISNKTIKAEQIEKIVLVKNKNITFLDSETGAILGFEVGSMFTPAVEFEPVNDISDYIPLLAGMLAGAVVGGSSIDKVKKRKLKIQGRLETFNELIPELRFYQYDSPVSFYAY